jgi:hypothetical protein
MLKHKSLYIHERMFQHQFNTHENFTSTNRLGKYIEVALDEKFVYYNEINFFFVFTCRAKIVHVVRLKLEKMSKNFNYWMGGIINKIKKYF